MVIYVYHLAKVVEVSCDALLVNMATTRKAGQMARVGAMVKGKVVMHKTRAQHQHSGPLQPHQSVWDGWFLGELDNLLMTWLA